MSCFVPAEGLHVVRRDTPGERRTFRLLRDHLVATETVRLVLPEGFEFDGASIPNWLRPVIAALDPWGRYEYAAAAHDLLYLTQRTGREEADLVFRVLMEARGVPYTCRLVMYWAVRIFGKKAWDAQPKFQRDYRTRGCMVQTKLPSQAWGDVDEEGLA